jgi:23S rRNA (guanosine2251-2'-O)-methyltransferase
LRTVYGVNPVRELLRAGSSGISELWLAEGQVRGKRLLELHQLARAAGARVREAPRAKLDRVAGTQAHQGVVATVADYRYCELEEILGAARHRNEPALVLILDGIEDPHNLGAIIRSGHALGAHGVVIPRDRAVGVTPAVAKVSAGAVEHCPVARVTNIAQTIERLKEEGIWSIAAVQGADRSLADIDLRGPIALIIGGEGEGVRPLVRRTSDYVASIPMAGRVGSLNASAAAAVALYEVLRQRRTR